MVENTTPSTQTKYESNLTSRIEDQTARIPSVAYLSLAAGSMALSAFLALATRRKELANFVGLWVPSILLIGVYNKLAKMEKQVSVEQSYH